jgi:hypothetical protein
MEQKQSTTLADIVKEELTENQRNIAASCPLSSCNSHYVLNFSDYVYFCNNVFQAVVGNHDYINQISRSDKADRLAVIKDSQIFFKKMHLAILEAGKLEFEGNDNFTKDSVEMIRVYAHGTDWTDNQRWTDFYHMFTRFKKGEYINF